MNMPLVLPGSIPGLLQEGSRVITSDGIVATVVGLYPAHPDFGTRAVCGLIPPHRNATLRHQDRVESLSLDLSSRTSRAHAAWWAGSVGATMTIDQWPSDMGWVVALHRARMGADMTDDQIDTLRRGCLLLAGMEDTP
jgi:hypothetical protein